MENHFIVLAIGFLAQGFFSARILVQWIMSERAKHVLSPSLFWIFSIAGAYLLCLYGWLRHDFAIVFGQCISYYIYLYNLKLKGIWTHVPWLLRSVLLLTPVVALCFVMGNVIPVMSISWKASVPITALETLPVMATKGTESRKAVAMPVTRFVAPGPEVAITTPG